MKKVGIEFSKTGGWIINLSLMRIKFAYVCLRTTKFISAMTYFLPLLFDEMNANVLVFDKEKTLCLIPSIHHFFL